MNELVEENVQVLAQLIELVSGMSATQYQQQFGLQRQQTIGKHVRHVVDHYEAFLHHSEAHAPVLVNYEHRRREPSLETVPDIACDRLRKLCDNLQQLLDTDLQNAVQVEYPTNRATSSLSSSVGRELTFLSSHTIHHMAIIGLLAEQLDLQPEPDFGVHTSTRRHWQKQERLAVAT
jgi:uncharacterized damage-inducible protein DinB